VALPSEVDTAGLIAGARGRGCPLGVPRVVGGDLWFCAAPASDSDLVPGALGVLEPAPDAARLEPSGRERTLVLVPGLLFDVEGGRLGRGGGYYDRFLSRIRQLPRVSVVGLCYDEQLVESLPRDPWDERVDAVVTQRRGLVECRPGRLQPEQGGASAP
jgi:5-formyltetrahydrofolate cyclo-ligase